MTPVAAAVINYNTRDQLRACLTSLRGADAGEVLVVDNGSTDGSAEMVAREFPEAAVHVDAGNPGYGAACNRAVAACAAPYVLLLNSDTVVRPGAVRALAAHLDAHPRAAVAGPRLVNPDGSLQPSTHRFPTPLAPLVRLSPVDAVARHVPWLRERRLGTWSHARARAVPWVTGAALAVRRAAFDAVGGFDPSYYMYFEEVDLSFRLRAAGWETHFTPAAEVVHVGGVSTRQHRAAMKAQVCVSAVRFYERHYAGLPRAAARRVLRLQTVGRWARDAVRLRLARDPRRRAELADDLWAWRRALAATRAAS